LITYGATSIPVAVPGNPLTEATGDPALDVWAAFLKAYVNAYGVAAWNACYPRTNTQAELIPPIRTTHTHNPTRRTVLPFNERDFPCLFIYRTGGAAPEWEWLDGRVKHDNVTALWVFPTGAQEATRIRVPFAKALQALFDAGIEKMRDPSYVHPSDTDPTAASIAADTDSIKTSVATITSVQTYSGAALNGVIGGTAFVQPRAFTVTITGPTSAFVNGSTVTVTGNDVLGRTMTRTIAISNAVSPATFATDYAFTQITQVQTAAQADVLGAFEFGLGAYQGRGSLLMNFTPNGLKRAGNWQVEQVEVEISSGIGDAPMKEIRVYEAVSIPFETFEVWDRDDFSAFNGLNGTLSANQAGYEQEMRIPIV
jgi:hypothetical protein